MTELTVTEEEIAWSMKWATGLAGERFAPGSRTDAVARVLLALAAERDTLRAALVDAVTVANQHLHERDALRAQVNIASADLMAAWRRADRAEAALRLVGEAVQISTDDIVVLRDEVLRALVAEVAP